MASSAGPERAVVCEDTMEFGERHSVFPFDFTDRVGARPRESIAGREEID
jgi:hypothetical protein